MALLLLLLAMFPWGLLRGTVERTLARRIGAPVTVGSMERVEAVSLRPRLRLRDVAIAQPTWAGRGALATIRVAEVRLPVLPLLIGKVRVDKVQLDGAALNLVRDRQGRENWRLGGARGGGGGSPSDILLSHSRLSMVDAKRQMRFAGPIAADADGLRLDGQGTHRGRPMRITARTGPAHPDQPLHLVITAPLLAVDARVRLARPFSLRRMEGDVTARASDAEVLDDVIEAGLPGTQPVRLTARLHRDGDHWRIPRIAGTVGGSRLTAVLDVDKQGGRLKLNGTVRAARLDFDDFGSDQDQAEGRARRARIGPRIVPYANIDLSRLGNLDGRVALSSPNLVVQGAPMFRTLRTVVTLDRRLLSIAPIHVGLGHGRVEGRATVDHRAGLPKLDVNLALRGGDVEELFGSDIIRASLDGRMRLSGRGLNVRAAAAHARGTVAMAARNGDVRRRMAALAGGDVLDRSDKAERVALRCMVVRLDAVPGRLIGRSFVVDTAVSRIDARGSLSLPAETMSAVLNGRSKQPDFIRAVPSVRLDGTLSNPRFVFPAVEREGGFFGKVGAALKVLRIGKQDDRAPDANCAALSAQALG